MSNDVAYMARRHELWLVLKRGSGPRSCASLAEQLGWPSAEVWAKLVSLRADGFVTYADVVTYADGAWSAR